MRVLIQRVKKASVTIHEAAHSSIDQGLLILIGIENEDTNEDTEWLVKKVANLRIFDDTNNVMNLSVKDIQGECLVVSQFTLHASTKKGNRPSYIKAAGHDHAIPLYERFCQELEIETNRTVKTGVFGADMQIGLINDGPVSIWIDSKRKE